MIHDVSFPAALIAGLISFLSPCVLPLVPPYLIYLTGATIEHVAHDQNKASSRRAVMIAALMFVLGAAFHTGRHRHHHHGPAFSWADPNWIVDARGPADRAEAGRVMGRLCDG